MEIKVHVVESKILDISILVTNAVLNKKIGETGGKKTDNSVLVNTVVLNTKIGEPKNKISCLFRKTVRDIKIKCFTTSDYNKLMNVIPDIKAELKE